ncbi:enoyl-CoA hydratase-related protein [Jannaschia seohaensis]|uniref:2-(1,2-epoxy-1,2-dihydrophenyl)acetyl-CoA isomerase n=1 Tax=Jannaschia seohaensis TaxID=475081 RepID=A0A2Y9AN01_9RHOB|nr:enoyl-CoA hydratase-related protein [Jannaschia seohaensis]PWJ20612.1 2-(1,2-epoxy-1,2-dihydrophenyl)acetyl-CoA isomerase [Jannaschia seohaensis]SSA44708.1 2-(1,2-epoxy-1,2-dihydrophenyl)acetyl-CoA isomerase [Jannaschia seohaensis]
MSGADHLLVRQDGACLHLTLNRPEKLNALTTETVTGLTHAIQQASTDPEVRAILLTGTGRAFCTGQDLGRRNPDGPDWPPDLSASVETVYGPLIKSILRSPKPLVCAVNGVAAGAGANLALACDIVLASKTARFIQSFSRVGLIPDAAGTWVLPRLIGLARARAICLTGRPVTAAEAEAWGMIWKSVPDPDLAAEARALATSLAAGPTRALGLTKEALLASAGASLDEQISAEARAQAEAGATSDYAEGVRAFLQKRQPRFRGE